MEFAANTFADADDNTETDVVVYYALWKVSREEDNSTVPSDFFTRNPDTGELEALISNGVFCLAFFGTRGNRLVVRQGCRLVVRESGLLNSDIPGLGQPILWGLNIKNALWEFSSNLNPGQEPGFLVSDRIQLPPNIRDFNIDYRWDTCYLKAKAFDDNVNLNTQAGLILVSVVQYLRINFQGFFQSFWVRTTHRFLGRRGEVCMPVACCKQPFCQNVELYGTVSARKLFPFIAYEASDNLAHQGFSAAKAVAIDYNVLPVGNVANSLTRTPPVGPVYPSLARCDAGADHYRFFEEILP